MIIIAGSREENLIKKSIARLNSLVTCRDVRDRKKIYKSLFRIFLNNPDIFRFLNHEIYSSYLMAMLNSQFTCIIPEYRITTIAIAIKHNKDVDIDANDTVDKSKIELLLHFVSLIKTKICNTRSYNEFYTLFKDFEED